MKPPAFTYHRPADVAEALAVLAEAGPHGKVLAGGQSLVPVLNMRLAAPEHLIDINRLAELAYVRSDAGAVRVGALARHAAIERDADAYAVLPLLRRATAYVAHPTIRNRGTTVGSLVHADPAAEMPAVLLLCDGTVELASAELASAGVTRSVAAADFFLGPLESAVRPGELAVAATFRVPPERTGTAFTEVSRRAGDYALCGVAVAVTLDTDLRISRARASYVSVGPTPVLVDLTDAVGGQPGDAADWAAAGALAESQVDPDDDIHATASYRRHLARVLTVRAGEVAARDALSRGRRSEHREPTASEHRRAARPEERSERGGEHMSVNAEHEVRLTVNGVPRNATVPARRLLSDFLRHDLRLTGTHVGCEHGVCGACTVLLDGVPVRSCLIFAVSVDGSEITTMEGCRNPQGGLGPVQRAFAECHGLQCGFCTPGFVTTVTAYLREHPNPTAAEAREAIGGNLCRCTGYQNIVTSVLRAAEILREKREAGK